MCSTVTNIVVNCSKFDLFPSLVKYDISLESLNFLSEEVKLSLIR